MPRKRTVEEIAAAEQKEKPKAKGRSAPPKPKARASRATASKAGGKKRPTRPGSTRQTAAQITARNAQIAEFREVRRLPWETIAQHFKIDVKTAQRGYDAHVDARQQEVSFDQAMRDMREYVAVLRRNQEVLAGITHELSPLNAKNGEEPTRQEVRARIAAIHEQSELVFKEIALRQAIGDLPADFGQLIEARDFDAIMAQVLALLQERNLPREVFAEIEAIIDGQLGVAVPKTHLAAVGS